MNEIQNSQAEKEISNLSLIVFCVYHLLAFFNWKDISKINLNFTL